MTRRSATSDTTPGPRRGRAAAVGAILTAVSLLAACSSGRPEDNRVVSLPDPTASTTTTLGPPIQYTPVYAEGPCPHDLPVPTDLLGISCGHLTVPQNRYDAEDGNVVLTVAVVHSLSPTPLPDPVVYLDGGPGASGIGSLGLWIESPILEQRDIILVGQRGTRYSAPTLDCPESRQLVFPQMAEQGDSAAVLEAQLEATKRCQSRLDGDGVPLSSYNTDENAADIADLRTAMGYEQWNLLGISYGTRLALEVMRDRPEGIRSVVLDSTYPTGLDVSAEVIPNAQRALDALFASCESTSCATRYPDLRGRFAALADRLEAEPQSVTVTKQGANGAEVTILWDADRLVRFMFSAMYDAELIALLPSLLQSFENNDFTEASEFYAELSADAAQSFSDGMYRSVQCRERLSITDQAAIDARAEGIDDDVVRAMSLTPELRDCEVWDVHPAGADVNEPITSDLPTLVLAGEFDPITPPAWGEMVAGALSNATFVRFPGIGHGATPEPCPTQIILDFLAAPGGVGSGCVAGMGPPAWR